MHTGKCFGTKTVARVFLSLLFVVNSISFIMHFSEMTKVVAGGLMPVGLSGVATLATILAIVFQLVGGLFLLFHYQTSLGAWMLIVFMALATLMYHTNWSGDGGRMQMMSFLENLAVIGGLLLFTRHSCSGCSGHEEKCGSDTCCQGDSCCKKEEAPTA